MLLVALRAYGGIRQQAKHLAHHAELYEAGLPREPKPAARQCPDDDIAPDGIVDDVDNLYYIHGFLINLVAKIQYFCYILFANSKFCIIFGFAEGTYVRKNSNKIWLFARLFVPLQSE